LRAQTDRSARQQTWLDRYMAGCPSCQSQIAAVDRLVAPIRTLDPPSPNPDETQALWQSCIEAIDQNAKATITRTDRASYRRWLWVGATGLAAILVLIGGRYLVLKSARHTGNIEHHRPDTALVHCGVTPLKIGHGPQGEPDLSHTKFLEPGGTIGAGDHGIVLDSADDTIHLELAPGSLLERTKNDGWSLLLIRGALLATARSPETAPCLHIRTHFGRIRITGTKFVVQARSGQTTVSVIKGRIQFLRAKSHPIAVAQGHQLTVRANSYDQSVWTTQPWPVTQGQRHVEMRSRTAATPRPARTPTARECTPRAVKSLARHSVTKALTRTSQCRKAGRGGGSLEAIRAELLLATGKTRRALKAYRRIARRYRGTTLGQDAMFTASQILLSRLHDRASASALLRQYLRRYPNGRYAADAYRIMRIRPPSTRSAKDAIMQ